MSPYASQELLFDLSDKIADARNHLYSLEENDEEYDVKKMVLEHGLASLEAQFETEQREEQYRQHEKDVESAGDKEVDNIPIDNQRPRSGEATMRPANGFAAYAGSSHNALGGHFASDGVMAGQGRPAAAPSWGFDSLQETVKTPDTANFPSFDDHNESKSISSPDSGFLRPTKRQRESLGISNSSSHPAKSLRTTPSPAITGPTTPTSFDSCELPDDPDLFRLLGGDPHDDLREMREEQKLQQELLERLEAKRKQEREDFELAQSMEQEDQFVTPRQYPSAGPSTTPRGASQTILDAQGQYLQPDPHSSSPVAVREDPFSSYTLPVKQEYAQRNGTGQNTFKLENTFRNNNDAAAVNKGNFHQPKSHRIPTSEFIDLGSDDDFDIPSGANNSHPSSDPVEIDAGTFAGNIGDGQSDVINTGAYYPYGITTGSSNPINWGYTGGKFGQMLGDPVKNTFNSAYDAVGQQVSGYGRNLAGLGGTSVYSTNIVGSSSNFVDLDSYDQQPYDLTSDIFGRHGINPDDPANRALVESYTNRIDYVTHDPTRTAAEIKALLENIRPDEELPPENREGTPDAMTYALMEHQKLGLTWMRNMEEGSAKGGILGNLPPQYVYRRKDCRANTTLQRMIWDSGRQVWASYPLMPQPPANLTIVQALALMVARRSEDRSCKTTLIVAPVALLKQWEREIRQKLKPCPRHTLTTFILHGERRHITFERLRAYDAVLTTFGE